MCYQNLPLQAPVAVEYVPAGQSGSTFLGGRPAPLAGVAVAVPGQPSSFHADVRGVLEALVTGRAYITTPALRSPWNSSTTCPCRPPTMTYARSWPSCSFRHLQHSHNPIALQRPR